MLSSREIIVPTARLRSSRRPSSRALYRLLNAQRAPFGRCARCKGPFVSRHWCQACESRRFRDEFASWTSGNMAIDALIRETQLAARDKTAYLEWIPFERFTDVRFLARGGFATVYSATWRNGLRQLWDETTQQFVRHGDRKVVLKALTGSQSISVDFLNEIRSNFSCRDAHYILPCFGVTRNPKTREYMMVIQYANGGDLATYITKHHGTLRWEDKLFVLSEVARGIKSIHRHGLVHGDLHCGNILQRGLNSSISDVGLCGPADRISDSEHVYGCLPYVAPEILKRRSYTTNADVYSFGVIMWQLSSGIRPYCRESHNVRLALDVCRGRRPPVPPDTPSCYASLMSRCWDPDPACRPSADELCECLSSWYSAVSGRANSDVASQFRLADQRRAVNKLSQPRDTRQKTRHHPGAVYTSRALTEHVEYVTSLSIGDDPSKH